MNNEKTILKGWGYYVKIKDNNGNVWVYVYIPVESGQ
jgi:hypothetical protein